jgi:hypothetical protein
VDPSVEAEILQRVAMGQGLEAIAKAMKINTVELKKSPTFGEKYLAAKKLAAAGSIKH